MLSVFMDYMLTFVIPLIIVLPCVMVFIVASELLILIESIESHVRSPIDPITVYADKLFICYTDT